MLLGGIVVVGVFLALILGIVNGTLSKTAFTDYHDDAEGYNIMALHIAEGRSGELAHILGSPETSRRPIGYPFFLSLIYRVWASPVAAYAAQITLWAVSIILFFKIALFFLSRGWALVAAFGYALSWFVATFVTQIGSDFFGAFLGLVFVWSLLQFLDSAKARGNQLEKPQSSRPASGMLLLARPRSPAFGGNHARSASAKFFSFDFLWLFSAALALGTMAITRSVMLYFIPIVVVYLTIVFWKDSLLRLVVPILFFFISGSVVAAGMWWTYSVFGTTEIAATRHVLLSRSQEGFWPAERVASVAAAAFGGDLVADYFFPGYLENPAPYHQFPEVLMRRAAAKAAGIPEPEMEAEFQKEAFQNIKRHPVMFLITGALNVVRLHAPMNHRGEGMFRFLVGKNLPFWLRALANVFVRVFWFAFLAIAWWGIVRAIVARASAWELWALIALLILYTVGIHSLFANAEPRFLITVLSFYILFAMYAVSRRAGGAL